MEVKRIKDHVETLEKKMEESLKTYDSMVALWNEFDPTIVRVNDVEITIKRFAGVQIPELGRSILKCIRLAFSPHHLGIWRGHSSSSQWRP